MDKNKGGRPAETCERDAQVSDEPPTLAVLGIGRHQAAAWEAEASIPEPIFEAAIEEAIAEDKPLTTAGMVDRILLPERPIGQPGLDVAKIPERHARELEPLVSESEPERPKAVALLSRSPSPQ
jgi:hypothetical protein